MRLSVDKWKPFKVCRSLQVNKKFKKQRGLLDIEACKSACAGDLIDGDDLCYIGAKKSENGVMKRVVRDDELVSAGNGILFICNGEGSVGYKLYMDTEFIGSRDVSIGYDEHLTRNIGLFMVAVMDEDKYRYSFGRKYRPTIMSATCLLPIQRDGDGKPVIDSASPYSDEGFLPDWDFMENYIQSLNEDFTATQNKSGNVPQLEVSEWKPFRISSLFTPLLADGDIKLADMDAGTIPLVSSGSTDNGIAGYISTAGDGVSEIFPGNQMTVGMFCHAFYQPEPFYAVSHGRVNILNPLFPLNRYIALFIATIINKEQYKHSYGRAVYQGEISSMTISLPVTEDGDPDWDYMENYIKSLPNGDLL